MKITIMNEAPAIEFSRNQFGAGGKWEELYGVMKTAKSGQWLHMNLPNKIMAERARSAAVGRHAIHKTGNKYATHVTKGENGTFDLWIETK